MKTFLKDWKSGTDFGILLLRFGLGYAMFYGHGLGKLQYLMSGQEISFMDPIGIGHTGSFVLIALAEGICSLLIMLGLFTRFAAIPLMIGMAVIVFSVHGADPFGKFELPLVYLVGFGTLFLTGGGKHSLDRLITR